MKLPEVLDFCREHELWSDYYDTWMMLGEEYSFSGEYSKAINVVQEIHDDATKRGNKYGLTASEFIKGLVYDGQGNYKESASSFEAALSNYPANGAPFQKNSIYVYYLTELKNLHNADKMRSTLAESRNAAKTQQSSRFNSTTGCTTIIIHAICTIFIKRISTRLPCK